MVIFCTCKKEKAVCNCKLMWPSLFDGILLQNLSKKPSFMVPHRTISFFDSKFVLLNTSRLSCMWAWKCYLFMYVSRLQISLKKNGQREDRQSLCAWLYLMKMWLWKISLWHISLFQHGTSLAEDQLCSWWGLDVPFTLCFCQSTDPDIFRS